MQPEVAKFLHDVRKACERLQRFTAGKSFAEYQVDEEKQAAVERQFITLGEALAQASKLDPTLSQFITAIGQIIAFRNILVHGYARVKHETVWGVIENDLAVLTKEVENLLRRIPQGPAG
jgi:uncharacterized protein with HEPN domain